MDVETVSTADHSPLDGVRETLAQADGTLLCVAYDATVSLLEKGEVDIVELSPFGYVRAESRGDPT